MATHFIEDRTIHPSTIALDDFKDFMKKMQNGEGIGRMRLDVDGNIVEGLNMELMVDDNN